MHLQSTSPVLVLALAIVLTQSQATTTTTPTPTPPTSFPSDLPAEISSLLFAVPSNLGSEIAQATSLFVSVYVAATSAAAPIISSASADGEHLGQEVSKLVESVYGVVTSAAASVVGGLGDDGGDGGDVAMVTAIAASTTSTTPDSSTAEPTNAFANSSPSIIGPQTSLTDTRTTGLAGTTTTSTSKSSAEAKRGVQRRADGRLAAAMFAAVAFV